MVKNKIQRRKANKEVTKLIRSKHNLGPMLCKKNIEPKNMMNQKKLTQLFKRQRKSELYNEIAHMKETLPQNPYKLYSGIRFDHNSRPVEIIQPLDLNELKLIVRKKCNIKLRSDRIERAYQRSGKNTIEIQKNLDQYEGRTVIRLKNNYPYNWKSVI